MWNTRQKASLIIYVHLKAIVVWYKTEFEDKKINKLLKTINSTDKQWEWHSLSTVIAYLAVEQ